jgi:Flagellar hook-length control protein FliK
MFGSADVADRVDSNIPNDKAGDKSGTKADALNIAQLDTRFASDTVIADALVRSMLGGRAAIAGTSVPVAPPAKIKQTGVASGDSAVTLTVQVAVMTTVSDAAAVIESAAADRPQPLQSGAHPQVASMPIAPAGLPIVSNAPLAFAAVLTPISQAAAPESTLPGTNIDTQAIYPLPLDAVRCPNSADTQSSAQIEMQSETQSNSPSYALPDAKIDTPSDTKTDSQESKSKATVSGLQIAHAILHGDREDDAPKVSAMAASTSTSMSPQGFAQALDNPAAPATPHSSIADSTTSNTFGAVADTLRSSETAHIAIPVAASLNAGSAVQDITVRVNRADMPAVDLRVTERAGEIHVTVRTADAGLETSLRRDLPTLTNSLEHAGYRTETFVPRGAHESAQLLNKLSTQTDSREDREARQESSGRESSRDANQRDTNQRDANQGRRQHEQPKRHHDQLAQNWIDQMEKQS